MSDGAPLILTLTVDQRSFRFFDDQRRRFFPPERNHIPAHVTLFHALPGREHARIAGDLAQLCASQARVMLRVAGLRNLGRGVAYRLESDELSALRSRLAELWAPWLGQQDRQRFRPHVTVQNKVEPPQAQALLADLEATFVPFTATGEGLDLWWYRGGPWELAQSFRFGGGELQKS